MNADDPPNPHEIIEPPDASSTPEVPGLKQRPQMRRLFTLVSAPVLLIGLIAGGAVAYLERPHVYWATSGYSQRSFLLAFDSEPSEDTLLDAMIYKEPLIQDKQETTAEWRKAHTEGNRLGIKLDKNRSVVVSPYSSDREADTVFPDGGRIKGVWLTEPQTRIHFPVFLVRASYFLGAFLGAVLAVVLFQWLWYFALARLRELSQAIRGGEVFRPNKALQPTVLPPLRSGRPAAELGRWEL